jgi:hypothetical protein
LQAYLKIPTKRREDLVADTGKNAHDLLIEQLDIIRLDIQKRRVMIESDAGDLLVNQHHFLRSKQSSR